MLAVFYLQNTIVDSIPCVLIGVNFIFCIRKRFSSLVYSFSSIYESSANSSNFFFSGTNKDIMETDFEATHTPKSD